MQKYVAGESVQVAQYHLEWANELKQKATETNEDVQTIIQNGVGEKFQRVLEYAGVFKQTESGQKAFHEFVAAFQ